MNALLLRIQSTITLSKASVLPFRMRRKGEREVNASIFAEKRIQGPNFSVLGRIQAAREFQAAKEGKEVQRQFEISEKRQQAAIKRSQKEEEKLQKAIIATEKRRMIAEAKAAKATKKQAQKALSKITKKPAKGELGIQKQSFGSNKVQKARKQQAKQPISLTILEEVEIATKVTLRGRQVQRPRRFIS